MAAASTDKVRKKKSNFSTTLSSGIDGSTGTIPLTSSSGLPTDTAVTLTIDRVDANAVSTPSKMERITGVVGVNQVTTSTRGVEGSAQSHSSGAVVEDIWEAATWNDLCTAFLVSHSQAGNLKPGTQIDDTSADHQYVLAVSELAADRTVTLPLLLSADTFVFADMIQTLVNKTLTAPVIASIVNSGTLLLPLTSDTLVGKATTDILTNKTLTSPLFSGNIDGWIATGDSWAYASANTITVPSGAAAKYRIGDKIKLTQTTDKYFYVTAVADTLLTVSAGSTYTVANAAITSPYYSHAASPIGFPDWFTFVPTLSGGTPPTFTIAFTGRFSMIGRLVRFNWYGENSAGGTAGSGANTLFFSLPVTPANGDGRIFGLGQYYNGGTSAHLSIRNDGTNGYFQKLSTAYLQSVDLNNASRFVYAELTYEA